MTTGYGRQMEDEAYDARRSKMKKRYLVGRNYNGEIIATQSDSPASITHEKLSNRNVIPASVDVVHAFTKKDAQILYEIYNRRAISVVKNNIRSVTINGKRFKV